MVYVISKTGKPLMPCKPARAKHLLKAGEAKVVNTKPFIIQLTIDSTEEVQPVVIGVDLGAKTVGIAAVGNDEVLYQAEARLRTDIHKRMETRAMYRRSRRSRKNRYRTPGSIKKLGKNRNIYHSKHRANALQEGRLLPSIKSRADTTIKVVKRMAKFLPVSHIVVEVANFDTQAMRAGRRLRGWAYQRGPQYGFENVKMYVRARDKYKCQYCGKRFPSDLEVDHIVPRSRGGTDRSDNLVAACHDCNQRKGKMTATEFGYPKIQEQVKKSLKAAAQTMAGKTYTLESLSTIATVTTTYGYITKIDREVMGLPKTHWCDAVAIACGGNKVEPLGYYENMRAVSRGARKQRQGKHSQRVARSPYEVFGFRQWDKVRLPDGTIGFVSTRRKTGSFRIQDVEGREIRGGITYKELTLLERARTLLVEQRAIAVAEESSALEGVEK